MSRPLKRWCSKLRAGFSRKTAAVESRSRGKFECLEARTVLSAPFGGIEGGSYYGSLAMHDNGGQQFGDVATFAKPSPKDGTWIDRGPAVGDPVTARLARPPEFNPLVGMGTREQVRYVYIIYSTNQIQPPPAYLSVHQDPFFDDAFAGKSNLHPPQFLASQRPPTSSQGDSSADGATNAPPAFAPPNLTSGESLAVAAAANSLADSLASASSNSLLSVSEIAHAAAFQDFATQRLLLANASASDEPGNSSDELSQHAGESVEIGGFLRRGEQSLFDAEWLSTTSIEEERRAVDEVLERLHDPTATRDDESKHKVGDGRHGPGEDADLIGFEEQLSIDETQSAADEGMILLQASGEANEGDVNLLAAVDEGLEIAEMMRGVEASVGIHQAFDMAEGDDLPASDIPRPVDSTEPLSQKDAVSGSETSTMQRAAVAAGATALFGVLQRKRKARRP
jgi:hypothetical protein